MVDAFEPQALGRSTTASKVVNAKLNKEEGENVEKVFIEQEKHIEIVEKYDVDGVTYSLCDFYYELEPATEERIVPDADGNPQTVTVQGFKAYAWRFGVPEGQELDKYVQVANEKGYVLPSEIITTRA